MELVEKNILPVESSLKEAIIGEGTCRPEAPGVVLVAAQGFSPLDFLLGLGGLRCRAGAWQAGRISLGRASGHRDQRRA